MTHSHDHAPVNKPAVTRSGVCWPSQRTDTHTHTQRYPCTACVHPPSSPCPAGPQLLVHQLTLALQGLNLSLCTQRGGGQRGAGRGRCSLQIQQHTFNVNSKTAAMLWTCTFLLQCCGHAPLSVLHWSGQNPEQTWYAAMPIARHGCTAL